MKYVDIKNMLEQELKDILAKSKSELVDLQFKAHSGTLKQVRNIRFIKKDIARILTRLSEYGKDSKK
ncbi:MAG: 50S ribosomal protein L29 [Parcubacteria group bacterium CG_4_9_14_0_2_um_filter_41_8]|nr:MAG: 50S ribosomal protein L29 [Parcubacteria group bacterium CG1_02_41_12]PIP67434.1 MAG: 50S ribosomal protein L29 [Parcubacteria group bacterium CG22_combo_CG10-13_8_21_14_all_41_9]PIQ79377.1 MAG: 50S ribosomal protein L29 [Parcubacteria group bacterium CG11_big_fil_rev_8_21_14_0_20_41_14]PIR57517.1 MAG: 50S ribosomal protein L29 [Parcubacteria group bacterium CG10_big_fil_rev_8_21_14_0_10_41_35]PIZ77727.1 MAG: 50S ribosomal protein L29 [Parcubacteria group bacterium CG_4_10_14_0_2_um_fil